MLKGPVMARTRSVQTGQLCDACDEKVEVGQWFVWKQLDATQSVLYRLMFVAHVSCLMAIGAKAGFDVDDKTLEAMRKKIIETGEVY